MGIVESSSPWRWMSRNEEGLDGSEVVLAEALRSVEDFSERAFFVVLGAAFAGFEGLSPGLIAG